MKKADMILIGVFILMAVLIYSGFYFFREFSGKGHVMAIIQHDDAIVERIDLERVKEPRKITIAGDYHNDILVEPGRIRFENSDCPDKICVHYGWLKKNGNIAVCMPNKVLIIIEEN